MEETCTRCGGGSRGSWTEEGDNRLCRPCAKLWLHSTSLAADRKGLAEFAAIKPKVVDMGATLPGKGTGGLRG